MQYVMNEWDKIIRPRAFELKIFKYIMSALYYILYSLCIDLELHDKII